MGWKMFQTKTLSSVFLYEFFSRCDLFRLLGLLMLAEWMVVFVWKNTKPRKVYSTEVSSVIL